MSARVSTDRNRWALAIGSIVTVAILVTAAVVQFDFQASGTGKSAKPMGTFGPKLEVSGLGVSGAAANNTTTQIQIFSAVPSAFRSPGMLFYPITGSAQSSNGADDEVLNVTLLPGNNTTAFFLSPGFDGIAQQWAALLSHDQGRNYPSLTVEAVRTVSMSGRVSIYQDYNNILYNPFDLQVLTLNATNLLSPNAEAWFEGTTVNTSSYSEIQLANLELNLSLGFSNEPLQLLTVADTPIGAKPIDNLQEQNRTSLRACGLSTDSCTTEYQYTYYDTTSSTLLKTVFINSTLPLIGVQIGTAAWSGDSIVDLGASVNVVNDTINLDSSQPYVSATNETTTTMSTSPSFAHTANVTLGSSIGVYQAIPLSISEDDKNNFSVSQNRTTAVVGIQGVEYEFQHFNQSTYDHEEEWEVTLCCTGSTCHSSRTLLWDKVIGSTYDGKYTSGGIIHINSTAGLEVQASYESIWVAWTMDHFVALSSNGTVSLTTSGTDDSYQASTIWGYTYGYTNAKGEFASYLNAVGTFTSALSLGLDIAVAAAAANAVDFDASEVAVLAAAAGIMLDVIGLATAVAGDFSSISFFSGSESITFTYGFSNAPTVGSGSSYTVSYFESSSETSFVVNSNQYNFYAPENWMNVTAIA
jgi:hypothetical protein